MSNTTLLLTGFDYKCLKYTFRRVPLGAPARQRFPLLAFLKSLFHKHAVHVPLGFIADSPRRLSSRISV